jgi:hypothetical protein
MVSCIPIEKTAALNNIIVYFHFISSYPWVVFRLLPGRRRAAASERLHTVHRLMTDTVLSPIVHLNFRYIPAGRIIFLRWIVSVQKCSKNNVITISEKKIQYSNVKLKIRARMRCIHVLICTVRTFKKTIFSNHFIIFKQFPKNYIFLDNTIVYY